MAAPTSSARAVLAAVAARALGTLCWLAGTLIAAPGMAQTSAQTIPPTALPASTVTATPAADGVVVVLSGGGARGFAHLAVLRQLERDRVPVLRIVGTSMGAVIGGLYASGLGLGEIETAIGALDPTRVALDQLDRSELPPSVRAYQQQYPINFEFGLRDGALDFSRGASDGQRFMALLQRLLAHVPGEVDFNRLKIPFRAVATRYRDGNAKVFDHGSLALAIRASMAAPGVFAPVEIDGETYVDGGLVANLPVEVALDEGAPLVLASALSADEVAPEAPSGNALVIANHMISILIRQNESRNLKLLRPQDVLVRADLRGVGFADFNRAAEIEQMGARAVAQAAPQWQRMRAALSASAAAARAPTPKLAADQRDVVIARIDVDGQRDLPPRFVQARLQALVGQAFDTTAVAAQIDWLYTSGYFEQVSYRLEQLRDEHYALVVRVVEKPYSPHFFKAGFGLSIELGGINQFSIGLGYRRPWLSESGLELALDARIGTSAELGLRLRQPLAPQWWLESGLRSSYGTIPVYLPDFEGEGRVTNQHFAYVHDQRAEWSLLMGYELGQHAVVKAGVLVADQRFNVSISQTLRLADGSGFELPSTRYRYGALSLQFTADRLDSVSFPTRGYYVNASVERGLSGERYDRLRLGAQWAQAWQAHVLTAGFNVGRDTTPSHCERNCEVPTNLFLGGFQFMGAYRMGQLSGDRLAHGYLTYMYRLSPGGLLRQPVYLGLVAERGDAWFALFGGAQPKNSVTLFGAVDSRIGDLYLGAARGSQGAYNAFLQLGRRFSF